MHGLIMHSQRSLQFKPHIGSMLGFGGCNVFREHNDARFPSELTQILRRIDMRPTPALADS